MAIAQSSDPIAGISSIATRHVLLELGNAYERQSGKRVTIESVGGVDAVRRVAQGDTFDFVVLAAEAIDKLAQSDRVDTATRIDIAGSGIAVAVKAGTTRPDIGNESAVRQAVLAARSIGYSTGASGVYVARLFERWKIAETIASRLVQAPPGVPVGSLIARGDVELGFQQLSELMNLAGIDVVGVLPPEIQLVTVFSAAVCTASPQPQLAKALLSFLASAEAEDAKRRHGMEPV